jgi:hypothetical protein
MERFTDATERFFAFVMVSLALEVPFVIPYNPTCLALMKLLADTRLFVVVKACSIVENFKAF